MGGRRNNSWGWLGWLMCGVSATAGCATPVHAPPRTSTKTDASSETTVYCAGTVTEHEAHRCVWELTPEQQRHRPYSQRLIFRSGRLLRMDTISGSGALVKTEDSTLFTYERGKIVATTWLSRNGVVKGGSRFETNDYAWWHDAQDRPSTKKESHASGLQRKLDARGRVVSYAYVDYVGRPATFEGVHEVRVKRNPQGAIVEESFFGEHGGPVLGSAGAHRITHQVDARGMDVELRYFGSDEAPMLAHGVHLIRYQSDAYGNELERAFFDVQGKPARSTSVGAAIVRTSRDEHGNGRLLEYLDESGRPLIGSDGFASRQLRFDGEDLPIEWKFFDEAGALLRQRDTGSPLMRQTRDARGNVVLERFYDEHANPMIGVEGYHRVEIGYDARDNPTSYRYTDADGNPVMIKSHYYEKRVDYDGDRRIRSSYFDTLGKPVSIDKGYAAYEIRYAEDGSEMKKIFLDVNGMAPEECRGSVNAELQAALLERAKEVRTCYEALLREKPQAGGKLLAQLRISNEGVVQKATLLTDEVDEPALSNCVLSRLSFSYQVGPTDGACADVRVPLVFKLKPGSSTAP